MKTWTTRTTVLGSPHEVIDVLTHPDAIARWAPIPFSVDRSDRLEAGTRTRVRGELAGRRLEFDVDVHTAGDGRLALRASGPIDIDVEYIVMPIDRGSDLHASVAVRGHGLAGRVLAQAIDTLLAAGALGAAVSGIARELAAVNDHRDSAELITRNPHLAVPA
jgi:hypothetical protein